MPADRNPDGIEPGIADGVDQFPRGLRGAPAGFHAGPFAVLGVAVKGIKGIPQVPAAFHVFYQGQGFVVRDFIAFHIGNDGHRNRFRRQGVFRPAGTGERDDPDGQDQGKQQSHVPHPFISLLFFLIIYDISCFGNVFSCFPA